MGPGLLMRYAAAPWLGAITSSSGKSSSVALKPEKTGVSRSAALSLMAKNPVPHPARVHFCPPEATMSAT